MKRSAPPIAIERIVEALNKDFELEMCRRFDRLCVDPRFDVHVGRWHQRFGWRLLVVLLVSYPLWGMVMVLLEPPFHVMVTNGFIQLTLHLLWYFFGGSTEAWIVRPCVQMKLPPMPDQDGTAKGSKPDPRVAMHATSSWRGALGDDGKRMGYTGTKMYRDLSCAEAAKNNPKMTPWALSERIERAHRRYQARKGLGVLPVRLYSNLVDWVMAVRQRRHHRRMHDVLARHSSQMTTSLEQELELSMQRLHQKAYGEEIVGSGIDQGDPPTLERMLGQMYTTGDTKILSLTFEVRVDEELVDRRSFVAESVTIGAGPAAMLRVKSEHGTVADLHLVMNVNGDGTVQLLDLGSRAGTKLNGEAISNAGMKDGDRIGIGDDVEILVLFEQA
jgi:hypothetical protein